MNDRHLYLFGGSPPFNERSAEKFADLTLNNQGKAALLFIEREGWKDYMPLYTSQLEHYGLHEFIYIPLTAKPDLHTIDALNKSTGIIICGGDTELYHELIVGSLFGECIKEMYNQGIPVAGFSAGALISPSHCVISPIDNLGNKHLFLNGLGLVENNVICVHFSKWNEEENLLSAIEKTGVPIGYGIDDYGVMYFENEQLIESESHHYYQYHGR